MVRFLLFQLYGPLASWGEVAVGEARSSAPHPTRSAVLGIVAASLGIRREDRDELAALSRGLAFACELRSFGSNLRDYHTAQVPTEAEVRKAEKAGRSVRTRRDELSLNGLKTVLSGRDYRENSLSRAALVRRDGSSAPDLERIAEALRHPRFVPYLGRRSCPAGLPFAPAIVEAETLVDALDTTPLLLPEGVERELYRALKLRTEPARLYWDEDVPSGIDEPSHVFDRRDDPAPEVSRGFHIRRELHATRIAGGRPCSSPV